MCPQLEGFTRCPDAQISCLQLVPSRLNRIRKCPFCVQLPQGNEIFLFLPVIWKSFFLLLFLLLFLRRLARVRDSLASQSLVGELIGFASSISSLVACVCFSFQMSSGRLNKDWIVATWGLHKLGLCWSFFWKLHEGLSLRWQTRNILKVTWWIISLKTTPYSCPRSWVLFFGVFFFSCYCCFFASEDWNFNCSTTVFNSWCPERAWFIN